MDNLENNTPPGAKLGLCRSTIYSKFLIAHQIFHWRPLWRPLWSQIFHCTEIWKNQIKKSLSSDMLDFWHFVFGCIWHRAKCICLCICVFSTVFVFFPFCLCLGRRSSLERLLSNSRVAFDHQNRHDHHQMSIQNFITLIGARTEKTRLGPDPGMVRLAKSY